MPLVDARPERQTALEDRPADDIAIDGPAALLRRLRCDSGQGDVFSRPLPAGA